MAGRLAEGLLQVRLRAFRLSQSQIRDREDVQGVGIVRQQRQHRLRVLLRLLEGLLVAAGGHQFGQFQLRAGVPGVHLGGLPKVRGGGFEVVSRQVRQAQLVVRLGIPRLRRRGILEMQDRDCVVLLLEFFLAFFQKPGFFGIRRLIAGR